MEDGSASSPFSAFILFPVLSLPPCPPWPSVISVVLSYWRSSEQDGGRDRRGQRRRQGGGAAPGAGRVVRGTRGAHGRQSERDADAGGDVRGSALRHAL